MNVSIRVDPFPSEADLRTLLSRVWGADVDIDLAAVLTRSLAHVCAFDGERLIGFVNVAWDGGQHASIFDTVVDPDYRRRGIGTMLVKRAADAARDRGATWLHVDFEPHLRAFYSECGFRPTEAGLIALR